MTGTYDGGFQEWTCDDSSLQAVDSSQIRKGKSCRMLIFFCTVAHRNVVRRDAFTFGVWHVLPLLFLNRKITQLRLQWHLIYRCWAECYANSNGTIFFFLNSGAGLDRPDLYTRHHSPLWQMGPARGYIWKVTKLSENGTWLIWICDLDLVVFASTVPCLQYVVRLLLILHKFSSVKLSFYYYHMLWNCFSIVDLPIRCPFPF